MLKFTLWSTDVLNKSTLTSFDGKSKKYNCYGEIKTTECISRPGQQFLGCWSRSQLELHIMQEDRRIGSQDGTLGCRGLWPMWGLAKGTPRYKLTASDSKAHFLFGDLLRYLSSFMPHLPISPDKKGKETKTHQSDCLLMNKLSNNSY